MYGLTSDDLRRAADAVAEEASENENTAEDWVNDGHPEHGEGQFMAASGLYELAGRMRSAAAQMDAAEARALVVGEATCPG